MLTDTQCKNAHKNAKAKAGKSFKLADDKGLFLLVKPGVKGWSKWWRFKYRFEGKEKGLSFGTYPETPLELARSRRDNARKLIASGVDPGEHRKATKTAKAELVANSLEVIAREWGQKKVEGWDETNHRSKRMLERNIFPWLGGKPITDILPRDILACLRRVEEHGTIETAHRTLMITGQVFRYAVATGRVDRDCTPDLKGALKPADSEHFAAITEPKEVAQLLRAIDGYTGGFMTFCALKLAPLVFVRPGELRAAKWQDIDLEKREWRYLVSKTNTQHIVPLSRQAIEVLEQLQPLTGGGHWLFPSERNPRNTEPGRCMSENTLNGALKRLGYGKDIMTSHGFRAMARTILDEVLCWRVDLIEHQLAHAVKDPNGRAYNRTAHLPERHKMMQSWSDYLDGLKKGADVIAFRTNLKQ